MNEGRRTFLFFFPNRASDTVPAPLGEKAKLRGRPSSHMINERVDQSVPSRFVPCIWAGAWVLSLTFSLRFFSLPATFSLSPLLFLLPFPVPATGKGIVCAPGVLSFGIVGPAESAVQPESPPFMQLRWAWTSLRHGQFPSPSQEPRGPQRHLVGAYMPGHLQNTGHRGVLVARETPEAG